MAAIGEVEESQEETAEGEPVKWADFPLETYASVLSELVHFSVKGVNSNADSGGVRLGREDILNLPYLSVRTLLEEEYIPTDYTKNTGKTATIMKQLRALENNPPTEYQELAAQVSSLKSKLYSARKEVTLETVSPRVRQLIFARTDGTYVSLTPLPAAGLSRMLNTHFDTHNEVVKAQKLPGRRRIQQGVIGVGGSNPQNIGAFVRDMQKTTFFAAPVENLAVRQAYRIHFKGISIRPSRKLLQEWAAWRTKATAKNSGKLPSDSRARTTEKTLVMRIAQEVLTSANQATELLRSCQDILPSDTLLADPLTDPAVRGLLDPALRTKHWAAQFGQKLALACGEAKDRDAKTHIVSLNSEAIALIARWFTQAAQ